MGSRADRVKSLSEILQPARKRGTELEQAVTSMFAVMNVYTGDQAKLTLRVAEWCSYLEDIRKAAKWTVVGKDKLPSVTAFITESGWRSGQGAGAAPSARNPEWVSLCPEPYIPGMINSHHRPELGI